MTDGLGHGGSVGNSGTSSDTSSGTSSDTCSGISSGNVVLIALPGAGKSTLGVVLAKILNKDFIDTDLVIQRQHDATLQMLIDQQGPDAFIRIEGEVLGNLEAKNTVIATGGSAVYSPAAMEHLAALGTVVYLEISYDSLVSRLIDLHERGVVLRGGTTMSLRELYEDRCPLYERYACLTVNIDDLSITAAARKVASALENNGGGGRI